MPFYSVHGYAPWALFLCPKGSAYLKRISPTGSGAERAFHKACRGPLEGWLEYDP